MTENQTSWNKTPGSDNRLNKMTNQYNTGTYLATLPLDEVALMICTEANGTDWLLNHIYLATADGTSKVDITAVQDHLHTGSGTGGSIREIYAANPRDIDLLLTKVTDLYEASWASPVYWIKAVTGTGSVENATDGTSGERSIRLRPNGTSGSGSTISYPHMRLAFSRSSLFVAKVRIETASSLALHIGVGADDITAADSNARKYQAEICTATNNNWFLRTATGAANSGSDTGIAMDTSRTSVMIYHNPTNTPEVDLTINSEDVFQKTSNIPTDGRTDDNNLVKVSIKNNTGADRPLHFYGCRVSYDIDDAWAK